MTALDKLGKLGDFIGIQNAAAIGTVYSSFEQQPEEYRQQFGDLLFVEGEPARDCPYAIPKTECRAITLAQLDRVCQHLSRRLESGQPWQVFRPQEGGGWVETKLTAASEVNLYDLNQHLILPSTKPFQCSMVELMAREQQDPDYFASHWYLM